ncbi:Cation/H+ exchanger, partial [Cladochytrium replicatum]
AHASDGTHQLFMRAAVMLSLILVSMHINGFLHHKKFNYLGESAVTIILGLFVATVWRFIDSDDQAKTIQLSSNLFYMVLLPPIIFEAGFTLQKVAFFRNLRSIVSLAFVGALFSTFLTSTLMYFFSKLTKTHWSFVESLVFGSLISSTDPVTVLSLLPSNVDKNLYMLIFGESALNDAVSIILFRFFTDLADPKMRLSVSSFFILVLQSAGVFIGSTIVGFAVAVLFALLTKHIRFMHDQPIYETTMLFIFAYLSYLLADILSLTGIISIFFCGIGMSYYAMNNVTKKAKSSVKVLLRFLSSTCEGFVFLYLGLGLLSFGGQTVYDPVLIVFSFLTIMISRCHVFLLIGLGWILPGGSRVPWNHATLIWWSGLRGAVAFALGVSFSEHPVFDADIKGQIFGTTVMTVVLTVMIFGGFTPAMLKGLKIIRPED